MLYLYEKNRLPPPHARRRGAHGPRRSRGLRHTRPRGRTATAQSGPARSRRHDGPRKTCETERAHTGATYSYSAIHTAGLARAITGTPHTASHSSTLESHVGRAHSHTHPLRKSSSGSSCACGVVVSTLAGRRVWKVANIGQKTESGLRVEKTCSTSGRL